MTKRLSIFVVSTLFGFHDAAASFRSSCARSIRALLPNAEGKTSFYLDERVTPSHLSYQDLALAIEKRFEELEHVQELSIKHSFDSIDDKWVPPRNRYFAAYRLKLRFKAMVGFDFQNFRCRMTVQFSSHSEPGDVLIYIHECQNSQGLVLEDFGIRDLLSSKIRTIKAKNL